MTDHAQSAAAPDPLLERLRSAAQGLFIMSETDSPLSPFRWSLFFAPEGADKNGVAALREFKNLPAETLVEVVTLEKFFKMQVEPETGDDEEIAGDKRRLADLRDLLAKELQEVAVYRTGAVNITAYILGRIPGTSDAAGFSTELVET